MSVYAYLRMAKNPGSMKESGSPPKSNRWSLGYAPSLQKINRNPFIIFGDILPICKIHQFELLCLVHKSVYHSSHLPAVFNNYFIVNYSVHDHNTRSKNNLHLSYIQSGPKSGTLDWF